MTPITGQFIRQERKKQGLSLRELSRRAEIHAGLLSAIELGKRFPTLQDLNAITCVLIQVREFQKKQLLMRGLSTDQKIHAN